MTPIWNESWDEMWINGVRVPSPNRVKVSWPDTAESDELDALYQDHGGESG